MNFFLGVLTLLSVAFGIAYGQQGEKGNSIIPFPRVGRSGNSPGLIPFPRIGRAGEGAFHEMGKRQLIPFPRVGKRSFWPSPYYAPSEYDDLMGLNFESNPLSLGFEPSEAEAEMDKRSGATPNAQGGMWFGPRLGRKKRSTAAASSAEPTETVDILKLIQHSNWALIVPVKSERERRNFTPRLGRGGSFTVHQRGQPFSPRLGRSGEIASGSASNEPDEDFEEDEGRREGKRASPAEALFSQKDRSGPPFSPRMGRADPFSPRMGRDPFSPRLGRSGQSQSHKNEDRD